MHHLGTGDGAGIQSVGFGISGHKVLHRAGVRVKHMPFDRADISAVDMNADGDSVGKRVGHPVNVADQDGSGNIDVPITLGIRRIRDTRQPAGFQQAICSLLPCGMNLRFLHPVRHRGFVAPAGQFGHHLPVRRVLHEGSHGFLAVPDGQGPECQAIGFANFGTQASGRCNGLLFRSRRLDGEGNKEPDRVKAQPCNGNKWHR